MGETFTLVTTLKPKKPSNDDVIYESEDESIATVSKKGVITAVGAGKTTITVSAMNIVSKVNVTISGSNEVAVSVRETAAESSFTTSTPLKIDANAHFALVILPGGEATTGSVNTSSSIPAVAGLGCIPVTVLDLNDVVNVMACTKQDTAIDKQVTVSGTVENVPSVSGNSVTAKDKPRHVPGLILCIKLIFYILAVCSHK